MIDFVDERMNRSVPEFPRSPSQLLSLLETFAQSREHWLKVAGGAKGELLEHAFSLRKWEPFEVALECGTFVGYTAVRFATLMWRSCAKHSVARVMTVEVDPVHACIARHFLDLAGASRLVEVSIGQVRDVIPRIVEDFGVGTLGFVFMDYKGSIFHCDLESLELMNALSVNSIEVADNVALPGAPLLLWHLAFGPSWTLVVYAMMEFLEPNTEDWMALGRYKGHAGEAPPAPKSWQRLSWHTDHMRRRATGLRPTEGDMFEEDRVAYSRYVRRHFLDVGIVAMPWQGMVETDTDGG